ncbi:unnamed protein product [Diamesa tonsa]
MNKLLWFLAVLQVSCAYPETRLKKKEATECTDGMNNVYLADKNDCAKYFVCSSGKAIEKSCDKGFFFDPRYKECTFPEDVKCDPRTPKPRVNTDTSICRWRKDVKNIDGSYVMSLCYYDVELLYDDASMACRNHGMRLMRIENNSDQTAKMAHLVGMLGNGTGGIYHISGTNFVGRWFNDDNSQIYANIKWKNGREPWSGCLILNNEGPMAIDSDPYCSQEMHSICEYNREKIIDTRK